MCHGLKQRPGIPVTLSGLPEDLVRVLVCWHRRYGNRSVPVGAPRFFSYDIATKHESFFAFLGIIDPSSPLPLRGHQAQVTKCYMINVVVLFRLSVAARAMELQTVSTVGINQIRSHVRKKLKASCKSQVNASRFCFKDLMMTRLRTQHVCFSAGTTLRVPRGVQVWCRWHGDVCLRRCFITSFFLAIPITHHLGNLLLTKRV